VSVRNRRVRAQKARENSGAAKDKRLGKARRQRRAAGYFRSFTGPGAYASLRDASNAAARAASELLGCMWGQALPKRPGTAPSVERHTA
jgi:hypothetical protein